MSTDSGDAAFTSLMAAANAVGVFRDQLQARADALDPNSALADAYADEAEQAANVKAQLTNAAAKAVLAQVQPALTELNAVTQEMNVKSQGIAEDESKVQAVTSILDGFVNVATKLLPPANIEGALNAIASVQTSLGG